MIKVESAFFAVFAMSGSRREYATSAIVLPAFVVTPFGRCDLMWDKPVLDRLR
jgi:hypothetical protein